jgi:predicted CXXCH cytochrome family protein
MALALAAGGGWLIWSRQPPQVTPPHTAPPTPDPRLTFPTRYRNVQPDVAYIGAERCTPCHRGIAAQYRQHPMGQSMAALADDQDWEKFAPKPWKPFDAAGLHYRIEAKDDRLWHVESKRDAQGKDGVTQAEPVQYVVGSGMRGRSYIVERDRFLFQSPISWYAEDNRWDLSPGYAEKNAHFNRPITESCLFCHANRVDAERDMLHRFRRPIFAGHAIGCERCHGPGALHVQRHENGEEFEAPDDTIVQPARLEPLLRDAVCEQCHLQGEQRIERRGRAFFEFRPGLPLHAFLTIVVKRPEFADMQKSVGQVEQMTASRCFQKSQGKMGCISCHDPHALPAPGLKDTFFRDRCRKCHDAGGVECSQSPAERQARGDSCVACHMGRTGSSNVVHVSITDHRVLRRPDQGKQTPPRAAIESPWTAFHPPWQGYLAEHERDLGVVLANLAYEHRHRDTALVALPRLMNATERDPKDFAAWHARGNALQVLQRHDEALAAAESGLAAAPDNELCLRQTATFAMIARKLDVHFDTWERLVAANPQSAGYRAGLTNVHALRLEWTQAVAAAEAGLRLEATSSDLRTALIQALLRSGQRDRAQRELEILRVLQPRNLADVERWFSK